MIINSLGLCMIYFITFGDTMGQLVASFVDGASLNSDFYTSRYFYILILAAFLIAVVLKKELAELEWLSIVLFASLGLFILCDVIQLFFDSRFQPATVEKDFWVPTRELDTISALSVTMLAYSYQQNVYLIFSALKTKTNEEYKRVNLYGTMLTACIYFTLAIVSIFMFGEALDTQVLKNIGEARTADGKPFWEAYIVQISFSIVLLCHIPFIFTSGKEGLLIIIDEIMRKSISNALWHKLQGNEHFNRQTQGLPPPNPQLAIPGDTEPYAEVLRKSQQLTEANSPLHTQEGSPSEVKQQRMVQSIGILSEVPIEEANRMAYKDMNTVLYVGATLSFYAIIVMGAIAIEDIAIVFDFAGAIAVSAIAFFFPAHLYPKAINKFNVEKTSEVKMNICLSYFFWVLGAINFSLGIFVAILNIVEGGEGE